MADETNNKARSELAAFGKQLSERVRAIAARSSAQDASLATDAATARPAFDGDARVMNRTSPAVSTTSGHVATAEARSLPLTEILDSPYQPRKRQLTKKDVAELMTSIAAAGQTTPIIVTPADSGALGKYVLQAGHRRCAALRFLGQTMVFAVVRTDLGEREARKLTLADNLGREDLTAFEQASAVQEYAGAFAVSFETAAAELGLQERTAFRLKQVLGAGEKLAALIRDHGIAAKPGALLCRIEKTDERKALRLAVKYIDGNATSADLEAMGRDDRQPLRGTVASRDVDVQVDERVVSLKLKLVREAVSEEQKARTKVALAQVMAALDITSVEAAAS